MWAEAMNKLEGMESADRERLWPELVQGFKDLSRRLKVSIFFSNQGKGLPYWIIFSCASDFLQLFNISLDISCMQAWVKCPKEFKSI